MNRLIVLHFLHRLKSLWLIIALTGHLHVSQCALQKVFASFVINIGSSRRWWLNLKSGVVWWRRRWLSLKSGVVWRLWWRWWRLNLKSCEVLRQQERFYVRTSIWHRAWAANRGSMWWRMIARRACHQTDVGYGSFCISQLKKIGRYDVVSGLWKENCITVSHYINFKLTDKRPSSEPWFPAQLAPLQRSVSCSRWSYSNNPCTCGTEYCKASSSPKTPDFDSSGSSGSSGCSESFFECCCVPKTFSRPTACLY